MERKEYDLFMNMLSNPDSSFDNLVTSGLSIDNTSLQDRSTYENSDKVKEQFKDLYGEFDKAKFDAFYNSAKVYYNYLSQTDYNESMERLATFHRSNMSVDPDKRRQGPEFIELRVANPYHISQGIVTPGLIGERTKSADELMQNYRVLLNPTTAGENLENAEWGGSPNENFIEYFPETLVQARYSTAGTHKDLMTGLIVSHEKGELKTDETGNFYYETLDGRDIYDKVVLNKGNIITTDGSWANDLDFFDSDDLELKSVLGSTMKNLALVGTMFFPHVGPWIAGLSIATLLSGLLGTLGKMVVGSDNSTLSEMEGWAKSVSRQGATTEYAQLNPWCFENMINLVGDVMGLLREQRFIFRDAPSIIKGAPAINKTNYATKLKELTDKHTKLLKEKISTLLQNGVLNTDLLTSSAILLKRATQAALAEMDSFIKGYNKLGEILSRGYMTAITVGDTYGFAKNSGASDRDATLLTLGYAIGEYLLLRTGLGRWNIPETRLGKYKNQAIAKALTSLEDQTKLGAFLRAKQDLLTKDGKKTYVLKLLNIGKNLAKDVYTAEKANGTKTIAATLNSATAEGVEEVSEELLADFSKGCYNVFKWLQGEDTRLNTFGYDFTKEKWNGTEIRDRYLMSLVGGAIGGGLTNAVTNYKMIDSYNNMTNQQAVEELVYMARNGGLDDFMKDVYKMNLDDPNLSSNFEIINDQVVFNPGTKEDNRDLDLKRAILEQVNQIQNILSANGAVSDNELLDAQTLGDLRFQALYNSTTAGAYINEYNNLLSKILQELSTINTLSTRDLDTNKDGTVNDSENQHNQVSDNTKESIKNALKRIKEYKLKLDDLISGKRSVEFIASALWETTPFLSGLFTTVIFPLFAELRYGKKFKDLTEEEKNQAFKDYEIWKTTTGRDHIRDMAMTFLNIENNLSLVIKNHEQTYLQTSEELLELNRVINTAAFNSLILPDSIFVENLQSDVTNNGIATSNLVAKLASSIISILGTEELKALLEDINKRRLEALDNAPDNITLEELKNLHTPFNREQTDLVYNTIADNLHDYILVFINRGFANKETKNLLLNLIDQVRKKIISNKEAIYEAESTDLFGTNPYLELNDLLAKDEQLVKDLNNTPLEENLNEFAISIGLNPINLTQLMDKVNILFNESSNDITNFSITGIESELNNAIRVLELYSAAIKAARTDNASLNNLFGFNATLNEVASKTGQKLDLAEIDKLVADIFIDDINTNLTKLKTLLRLNTINKGLKLSKQDRVSTRKDLLVYKRMKYIVSILDKLDDWDEDSKVTLKGLIEGATLHDTMLNSKDNVPKDKETFLKENVAIENAIYDFFLANSDVFDNPEKLAKLINPTNLDLYTNSEELFNEDLEDFGDNSFIWWLASRAALKSLDFLYQYKQIINPNAEKPLAPIATLELAVYNNYANIINGKVFDSFSKALELSIKNDWSNLSVDKRKEVLKKLNKSEDYADDSFVKYAINFLPIPRYKNIILTEGIAGSGKTSAVFKSTIELLKKFHPEIANNIFVVNGVDINNAKELLSSLGLSKSFGREEFMRFISSVWKDYERDKNDNYIIPVTDYEITPDNKIQSKLKINKGLLNLPKVILIDEISRFTSYDIDLIDRFALEYGITVLAAGDFDQTGVRGTHKIPQDHVFDGSVWDVSLDRTNFIHSPKLGVSMRTDNIFLTLGLIKTQAYLHNPKGTLNLEYTENEEGLFGNKVITYNVDVKGEKDSITDYILLEVEKLAETLEKDENGEYILKIGYIYNDKTSKLYLELFKKKYIDLKKGGIALGTEGRYYIVDLDFNPDTQSFLKDLYTGITRAQQGTIIIAPTGSDKDIIHIASLKKDNLPIKESISNDVIAKYALNRKDILDKVVTNGQISQIIPKVQSPVPQSPAPVSPTPLPPASQPPTPQPPAIDPAILAAEQLADYEAEKKSLLLAISLATSENEINLLITNSKKAQLGTDPDILAEKNRKLLLFNLERINYKLKLLLDISNANNIDDLNLLVANAQIYYPDIFKDDVEAAYNLKKSEIEANIVNNTNLLLLRINLATTIEELDEIVSESDLKDSIINSAYQTLKAKIESQLTPPPDTFIPDISDDADDIAPITDKGIIDELVYKLELDSLNETKYVPESTVSQNNLNLPIHINMLLHSFNTFETGVIEGDNGEIILLGTPLQIDKRIDSVNGLIKIDKIRNHPLRTLQEYIDMIADLRNIIFNTENKADIDKKIQSYFGFSNIYTTFAYKSSPRISDIAITDLYGYFGKTATTFNKSNLERTLFNFANDKINNKSLVLIIGNTKDGDVLELPLLTLSSPFTILYANDENKNKPFAEIILYFENLANNLNPNWKADGILDLYSISKAIIDRYKSRIEYSELIQLFKLYNITGGLIKYIQNPLWTPLKNLHLIGALVVSKKGYYDITDQNKFDDPEWINLADFAGTTNYGNKINPYHNPQTYTTPIFISRTDSVNDIEGVVKKGHPFVLVSYDKSLRDEISVIKLYLKLQEDPNLPKKVILMYILPPKATVSQYLVNLYKIYHKMDGVLSIGYFTDLFKFLKNLTLQLDFIDLLNRKLGIVSLKLLTVLDLIPADATALLLKIILNRTEDWSKLGFGIGPQTLRYLFTGVLGKLVSIDRTIDDTVTHKMDIDAISQIEIIANSIGINSIYHHFKIPRNDHNNNGYFIIPNQDKYTLDGKPCMIHAKIDSYTFKGHMGDFINDLVNSLNLPKDVDPNSPLANNRYRTYDNIPYMNNASNVWTKSTTVNNIPNDVIDYIRERTGISINPSSFKSITDIANYINSVNGDFVSFVINNLLFITRSNKEIQGANKVIYHNGLPITDITGLIDTNGKFEFDLSINGKMYKGELDRQNNTIELIDTSLNTFNVTINPEDIIEYLNEGRTLLQDVFEVDEDLKKVFESATYEEFMQNLDLMDGLDPDDEVPGSESIRIDIIKNLTVPETELLKKIINDLIEVERTKHSCPTTIKLSF